MFEVMMGERKIRRALNAIARQRVSMILPGNVPFIENSPPHSEEFMTAVLTAHIRGWVEVLHAGLPTAQLRFEGSRPIIPETFSHQTHYRLTEGGWSVIHGNHAWLVATFVVSALALIASAVAVFMTYPS